MCFSGAYLVQLLVTLVIICAVIAVVRILLPRFAPAIDPAVLQIINIVVWTICVIALIWFAYDLISCELARPALRR